MAAPFALETHRLALRELGADDAGFILRLVNEPAWRRFIGDPGVRSLEGARAYVERVRESYARNGFGLWRVELKEGGQPVGLAGLLKREALDDVDLGFAFLGEHCGRGYATEAAGAVLAHGRRALGLGRIVAITSPGNASSIRVLGKLGFRYERMVALQPGGDEVRLYARPAAAAAERVRLRPVIEADLERFFEHQRDPAAIRMAAFTAADPSDRAAFDARWARLLSDPGLENRAILLDGEVAGHVARFGPPAQREVTYWLGREHWGQGLATAALALLLSELPERPVFARAARDNAASLRVLEKCGFRRYGADRGFAQGRGAEVEEVLLRLDGP